MLSSLATATTQSCDEAPRLSPRFERAVTVREAMRLSPQELVSRGLLSEAQVRELQQRQRGGRSGSGGYEYQKNYALLRSIELCHASQDAIVTMEVLCPVDDVVLERRGTHEHAQCKTSPATSWIADDRKLVREFRQQRDMFRKTGHTNYRLLLVVADRETSEELTQKAPQALGSSTSRKTEVVYFPLPDPPSKPWRLPRFAQALNQLLPPLLRSPSNREQLYKELNHIMTTATGWPGVSLSVHAMLSDAARSPALPIAMPRPIAPAWSVPLGDWQQALALLTRIQGLQLHTDGGVCCYTYGLETGLIARCDAPAFRRFVHDVVARPPGTMEDFLEMRPV